ncbi:hypothetical protein ABEB36_013851 [Hypothenemus hampei]|uniref:Uncharacterized protein n=1 Tax=Hypothenemus hampei TaxID=57062 RepID=A0ABD1E6D1_HYPHA
MCPSSRDGGREGSLKGLRKYLKKLLNTEKKAKRPYVSSNEQQDRDTVAHLEELNSLHGGVCYNQSSKDLWIRLGPPTTSNVLSSSAVQKRQHYAYIKKATVSQYKKPTLPGPELGTGNLTICYITVM